MQLIVCCSNFSNQRSEAIFQGLDAGPHSQAEAELVTFSRSSIYQIYTLSLWNRTRTLQQQRELRLLQTTASR